MINATEKWKTTMSKLKFKVIKERKTPFVGKRVWLALNLPPAEYLKAEKVIFEKCKDLNTKKYEDLWIQLRNIEDKLNGVDAKGPDYLECYEGSWISPSKLRRKKMITPSKSKLQLSKGWYLYKIDYCYG
jgi:hypothetical protein